MSDIVNVVVALFVIMLILLVLAVVVFIALAILQEQNRSGVSINWAILPAISIGYIRYSW